MMLLNIVGRDLALSTLVKHQPNLLSDISAVAVWIVYDVVAVYDDHTQGFSPSVMA